MRSEGWRGGENFLEIINHLKKCGFKWQQKHISLGFQSNSAARVNSQDPLQNWTQAANWSKKPNHCLFTEVRIYTPNDFQWWSKEKQGQMNEKGPSERVQDRNPEWRGKAIPIEKRRKKYNSLTDSLVSPIYTFSFLPLLLANFIFEPISAHASYFSLPSFLRWHLGSIS